MATKQNTFKKCCGRYLSFRPNEQVLTLARNYFYLKLHKQEVQHQISAKAKLYQKIFYVNNSLNKSSCLKKQITKF